MGVKQSAGEADLCVQYLSGLFVPISRRVAHVWRWACVRRDGAASGPPRGLFWRLAVCCLISRRAARFGGRERRATAAQPSGRPRAAPGVRRGGLRCGDAEIITDYLGC